MSPRLLAVIVAVLVIIVVGMALTVRKAARIQRDIEPPARTAPAGR